MHANLALGSTGMARLGMLSIASLLAYPVVAHRHCCSYPHVVLTYCRALRVRNCHHPACAGASCDLCPCTTSLVYFLLVACIKHTVAVQIDQVIAISQCSSLVALAGELLDGLQKVLPHPPAGSSGRQRYRLLFA